MADAAARCPQSEVLDAHLTGMSEPLEPPLDRTPLWTMDDLCRLLHTTPATVHTWRKRGTAPRAYRIGRHLLFAEADVKVWLEEHEATKVDERADSETGW